MFGAITALTLSLFWAARFIPVGSHGVPGLLSIGSLVNSPPGPVNFEPLIRKRCGYNVQTVIAREITERVRNRSPHIRIQVLHENKHKHKHRRAHKHQQVHKRERTRCRSRITATQPAFPIPPIPPVPPIPPIAPLAPLPAPGS